MVQVLLCKKIVINEAIVSLQTLECFSDEAIQLLFLLLLFEPIVWEPYFCGGDEGIRRFNLALKGQ